MREIKLIISIVLSMTMQHLLAIVNEKPDIQEWEIEFGEIMESDWSEPMEQWRDMLEELTENPLPINNARREKLEAIPFLSKEQTEALSYYVYRYGPVLHLSELLLVDGFNEQTLRMLKPFICLGDTMKQTGIQNQIKPSLKYGKQELKLLSGRVLQQKLGYMENVSNEEESGKKYSGDPWSVTVRYGYNYKDKFQFGFVLQKDAGERLPGKGMLPDYSSLHAVIKETGIIKALIAGDYSLSFGQGLVCGKSFSIGKNFSASNPEIYNQEIRRHFSSAESGFLRGLGASIYLKKKVPGFNRNKKDFEVILTGFGSFRKLDGNLTDSTFSSISETGLHRTNGEIQMHNTVKMMSTGTHVSFNFENIQVGVTGIYWHFNKVYYPELKPYNRFYFRGSNGADFSANYRFRYFKSTFFGEVAFDKNGKFAGIGGVSFLPFSRMNLSFLARYYSPDYASFFSNAFAEGSGVRNEIGWYGSMEWRILKGIRLNAFCDYFVFPWLSYGINSPSSGNEKGIQIIWQTDQDSEIMFRCKTKIKNENIISVDNKFPEILITKKNVYRLSYTYKMPQFDFQTIIDLNSIKKEYFSSATWGMALSQTINYKPKFADANIYLRIALFDATNYENRIFSYERSLPGSFSMPSLYGLGGRIGICFSYNVNRNISCWLKTGHFSYSDRNKTGTGSEESEGNLLTDMQALLRWKF